MRGRHGGDTIVKAIPLHRVTKVTGVLRAVEASLGSL